jgi:hypothetical protein
MVDDISLWINLFFCSNWRLKDHHLKKISLMVDMASRQQQKQKLGEHDSIVDWQSNCHVIE